MGSIQDIVTSSPGVASADRKEISWEEIDRRDWHLWILAILLMFVLGVSLLGFMFPSVFWVQGQLALQAPQQAFVGFSVLLALVLVYLLQRQLQMRRLKRQLFEARVAVHTVQHNAAVQAFLTLPGMSQFRDSLAMEYRRASSSGARLAIVVLRVLSASPEMMGRIAALLRPMLRRGEMMARISDNVLGLILPDMQLSDATAFGARAEEHLSSQVGEVELMSTVSGYPEQAASLAELENPLRSFLE